MIFHKTNYLSLKAEEEEEEARKEEAARLDFDPETWCSKLDELVTKTNLFLEFLFEKKDQIAQKKAKIAVATILQDLAKIVLWKTELSQKKKGGKRAGQSCVRCGAALWHHRVSPIS